MQKNTYLAPKPAGEALGIGEKETRELVKRGVLSSIPVGESGKFFKIPIEIAAIELEEYAKEHAALRRNGVSTDTVEAIDNSNLVAFDELSRQLLDTSRKGKKTRKQLERESLQQDYA